MDLSRETEGRRGWWWKRGGTRRGKGKGRGEERGRVGGEERRKGEGTSRRGVVTGRGRGRSASPSALNHRNQQYNHLLRRRAPRWSPSAYSPTSQPSSTLNNNCQRDIIFQGPIHRCSFCLIFLFPVVLFQPVMLRTARRHKPSSDSHDSIHVPQAQQNSLKSALRKAAKFIKQYVRVDQSTTTQASRQEQK